MAELPPIPAEVILHEIILRLPPDHPASLFRASAVSQRLRAFCRNADVIGRYRDLHRAPPVLGFLQNFLENRSLFLTANPYPPIYPPHFGCYDVAAALDCRHGRMLFYRIYQPPHQRLAVWNPFTRELQLLPELDRPAPRFNHFAGAVLCAVPGCNHLNCHGGPFRVLFVTAADKDVVVDDAHNPFAQIHVDFAWANLYSSETGDWTPPSIFLPGPGSVMHPCSEGLLMGPSLLAGDTLYFTLDLHARRTILRYDLGAHKLSVMDPPQSLRTRRDTFLVKVQDEELGVAVAEDSSLHLWSCNAGVWAPWRVIGLEGILTFTIGDPTMEFKVIGFAEMSRIIFVSANGSIIFTFNLNSGQVRRVGQTGNSTAIYPYEAFYTPGMEGA